MPRIFAAASNEFVPASTLVMCARSISCRLTASPIRGCWRGELSGDIERCSPPSSSLPLRMTARSITFCSSRIFPGQE